MKYYKIIDGNYIIAISVGNEGCVEISESEYETIMSAIISKPSDQDGYYYRLKTDMTWELFKLPPHAKKDDQDEEA